MSFGIRWIGATRFQVEPLSPSVVSLGVVVPAKTPIETSPANAWSADRTQASRLATMTRFMTRLLGMGGGGWA